MYNFVVQLESISAWSYSISRNIWIVQYYKQVDAILLDSKLFQSLKVTE